MKKLIFAAALMAALVQWAQAQDEQTSRMQTALASPARPAESKARDADRKPIETIKFMQIKTGDKVIEMVAAGGWFTEVLSAAVGPTGKVYASNPAGMVKEADEAALHKRLGNVVAVHGPLAGAGINGQADAAVVVLNLHDVYNGYFGNAGSEAIAVEFGKAIHAQLKPGGVLGIIDHAGIAGQDNTKLHRMLPQQARDVLTKAGFVIEAESNLFAHPADDHTKAVFDPSLRGKTDQFMYLARKPR